MHGESSIKKQSKTKWMSSGTYSYICMYINAAGNSVKLQLYEDLQHDFCNRIFKIKHKLYSAVGSALSN
jgi:hypothetical protein